MQVPGVLLLLQVLLPSSVLNWPQQVAAGCPITLKQAGLLALCIGSSNSQQSMSAMGLQLAAGNRKHTSVLSQSPCSLQHKAPCAWVV